MTPEQIATMTAIAALFKSIGTWPMLSILVLGQLTPWFVLIVVVIIQYQRSEATAKANEGRFSQNSSAQERRFEAVVKMYEDNVELVEKVIDLAHGYRDQLIWATQTVDQANSIAKNNLHCPLVRKNARPKDIDG